jgi:hypothetical protein
MTAIGDLAVILRFLFAKAIDERWRAVRVKHAEAELLERIRALNNVRTSSRRHAALMRPRNG